MSLNQIIAPVKKLDVVFNSVESDNGFVDKRSSIIVGGTTAGTGILSWVGYQGTFSGINSFVRRYNDPVSTQLCSEVFLSFTAPLNASTQIFSINYGIPNNYTLGYCSAGLFKPALPTLLVPGQATLTTQDQVKVVNIKFDYGESQVNAAVTSTTTIHLLLVETLA